MKGTYIVVLAALSLAVPALARDPAHVRLYCNSVRLLPGTAGPGQTLAVTTDPTLAEINNELSPLSGPPVYFRWDDPTFPDPITGQIAIDTPPRVDQNGNGFDDFFEVSQAVPSTKTTDGAFRTTVDSGTVTATWSRAAGATTGTCVVQMTGQMFGQLPAFTHTFELLEYTGTLDYVPTSNLITGALLVTQTGSPTNTLSGSFNLTRVLTNRFNQMNLLAGTVTNAAGQILSFSQSEIDRDEVAKTNYYGYVTFADGDPTTVTADYQIWVVSIDDTNDANANGIPDLSDDPTAVPQQGPRLGLVRSGGRLLLNITGTLGQSFNLQETASLSANWTNTTSLTLTNSPQVISLSVPATPTGFWRTRTP
jgi:hypothetical protein